MFTTMQLVGFGAGVNVSPILAGELSSEISSGGSGTSETFAATIPADCKFLIVFVHGVDNDLETQTVSGCTVGGNAMTGTTQRSGITSNNVGYVRGFYYANPPTGAQNIIASFDSTDATTITTVYISRPAEYVAEDGSTFSSGTSTSPSITTAEPLLILAGFTKYNNNALTSTGQTELQDAAISTVGRCKVSYVIQSASGSTTMSTSWSSDSSWGGTEIMSIRGA